MQKIKKYGWIRQLPDIRDRCYLESIERLPDSLDLSTLPYMPDVYDQGELGSCTANGTAAALEFDIRKQGLLDLLPSRLFIYFNTRSMEGNIDCDSGGTIRDAIKSVNTFGACSEVIWPYDISKFTDKPLPNCYSAALNNVSIKYHSVVQAQDVIKTCMNNGFPLVFGFTVYTSFEDGSWLSSGNMPIPDFENESVIGGHCVVLVGWDDNRQWSRGKGMWKIRNSWGSDWCENGYFWMPYEYLLNSALASDFWQIQTVK